MRQYVLLIGIIRIKDLRTSLNIRPTGQKKPISITLYDEVQREADADLLAERILFGFSLEARISKRTYKNRHDDFDDIVYKRICAHFPLSQLMKIHDVAVSDGRTAVDFYDRLITSYQNILFIASDGSPYFNIVEYNHCKLVFAISEDRKETAKLIEICFPPFVFYQNRPGHGVLPPINKLVLSFLKLWIVPRIIKMFNEDKIETHELALFHPRALSLIKRDKRFLLTQHNIINPFHDRFHVIRAMNILNISNFSTDEYYIIIKNVYDGLYEGGLFVTGRNEDANTIVHGSIYRKTNRGFVLIESSGMGSPINDLILSYESQLELDA